jgi:uncharacterized protein YndB with AHSA1/START domain
MRLRAVLPALLLAASGALHAELSGSSATGFVSSHQRTVQATPAQAFDAVARIERWWNAAHSYSGQGANLRLALRAGECFCEQWDGGSVEHARVIQVQPGSVVRLEGALGPLQELAVKGILTFTTGVADGKTFVRLTYRVSGSPDAGLDKLAAPVDRVIGDQFARWAAYAESTARP